jgi:hypothetical protein
MNTFESGGLAYPFDATACVTFHEFPVRDVK